METKNDSNGTVTIEGGYVTLRYERCLSHPPAAVWQAITDPKRAGSDEKEKVMCTL